jgi:hypothetical protein
LKQLQEKLLGSNGPVQELKFLQTSFSGLWAQHMCEVKSFIRKGADPNPQS